MQKKSAKQYLKELFTMFAIFFKIGLFSFGGGYAMLALIENEVVEKRGWLSHAELNEVFAIAESTPGPIAINTATFIGAKRLGIFGGIIATLDVVLPSFAIIVALSYVLELVMENKWVGFLFRGIRVGVLVLIAKAVLSFFKNMKKTVFSFFLCITAFILVFLVKVDVIYVILGTILVCSVVVAWQSYYKNHKLHMLGTAEYYNERVGKPLEAEEYVSDKAVKNSVLTVKTETLNPVFDEVAKDTKRSETAKRGGVGQ